jgi:hypothetical protein
VPTLVDDRYELLEVLASGGMATVWRARDTRLERLVALKRPHPAPAESKLHERMAREARAAAGVNHPNLVTMFDTGRDEGGPYLVMELVGGPTLASPGREIGPSEAVTIGAQIADALAAVHEAGIVHRDVKPSNVILSERGPCLTDFGIASIEEATRELTQPGTIMATPSYAAPEVLAGDPPSPASDVFSLSALVYGMLKGRPPYQGTDRASPPQKLDDPLVDAVIRNGLAIDPGKRPSASDLAARLRASAPTQAMAAAHDTLLMPAPIDLAPNAAEVTAADANATAALPIPIEAQRSSPPEPASPVPPPQTAEPVPLKPFEEPADRRRLAAVVMALVVVAALAAWPIRSPADPAADLPTTTVIVTAPASTTTPTTLPVDPVVAARERLAAILAGIRPPELKPKERAEIMKKVDDAIVLASNDPGEAEEAIKKAAELISKELGGSAEGEALAALVDLAGALGLNFSPKDDDGD